ncbi:MAG: phosphoribosylglycinamide formyltransferase [Fimbriimonadaceae bacterium]|nr:phosphoribosylglycinamide formyltransferase [Fimbriimonadaceae bacterium]
MEPRIAILTGSKGRGSNMAAIIKASQSGMIPAAVAVVIAPRENTPAAEVANELGVETEVCSPKQPDYADSLLNILTSNQITLICLAGYMTLLPLEVLNVFPNRVLNVHPALLPKFGGKGMYGHFVHEAVLAAKETVSGCSVHYVTEHYDEGAVIHQRSCPVFPDDTTETLAGRVLEQEHIAYPEAINIVLRLL